MAAGRAEPLFGDRGEVHVVLVLDRHRQGRRQFVEEGGGVPAGQVAGVAQLAGLRVEGAGGRDDQPVHVGAPEPGGLDGLAERLGHLCDGVAALPVGVFEAADHLAGEVGDGRRDPVGGDVESTHVGGAGVEGVELGVGPGLAAVGAGGHDQPGGLQPGQQLGGGGLGQAGQVPDPGPGQRSVRQQELQRGAVVHGAQQAGRSGGGGGHGAGLSLTEANC